MTSRPEQSKAWGEGYVAGNSGKNRAANPYIGKNTEKAKSWDEGWKESSGYYLNA